MTPLLPAELWLDIADYLDTVSIACLSLTCVFLSRLLAKSPQFRRLNEYDNSHEKYRVLCALERPSDYICISCMKLHDWTRRPISLGRVFEKQTDGCTRWETRISQTTYWPVHATILLKRGLHHRSLKWGVTFNHFNLTWKEQGWQIEMAPLLRHDDLLLLKVESTRILSADAFNSLIQEVPQDIATAGRNAPMFQRARALGLSKAACCACCINPVAEQIMHQLCGLVLDHPTGGCNIASPCKRRDEAASGGEAIRASAWFECGERYCSSWYKVEMTCLPDGQHRLSVLRHYDLGLADHWQFKPDKVYGPERFVNVKASFISFGVETPRPYWNVDYYYRREYSEPVDVPKWLEYCFRLMDFCLERDWRILLGRPKKQEKPKTIVRRLHMDAKSLVRTRTL